MVLLLKTSKAEDCKSITEKRIEALSNVRSTALKYMDVPFSRFVYM